MEKSNSEKISWKGYVSLIVLIILFSGIFKDSHSFLKAFDFANLTGKFGAIANGVDFMGKNGSGSKDGFLFALSLIPTISLAVGIIDVVEHLGAMKAAEKIFNPILKPILGIPGSTGVAFVSSFTSSDVAAIMTRQLYENRQITDDERTIFVSYQYSASSVVLNTINTQAPLLPIIVLPVGPIILVLLLCKIIGSNLTRLIIKLTNDKEKRRIANA